MKALLSSPNGRKKYQEYQESGLISQSPNKLLGSPSLLERLRAARTDRDLGSLEKSQSRTDEDEEEDEETLQLKLQAIEAKLKLKKLQAQKTRDIENVRPNDVERAPKVEVALSPTRRTAAALQKSPSRVLLGIDKGRTADDVSLRRTRTIHGSPTKKQVHHVDARLSRPTSNTNNAQAAPAKSFSGRMAEMRDRETTREQKSSAAHGARSSRFKVDRTELASYHAASNVSSSSAVTDGADHESKHAYSSQSAASSQRALHEISRVIKQSHSMPSLRSIPPGRAAPPPVSSPAISASSKKGDPALYEDFSRTHLSSRILPHTFLTRTLPKDQFTTYTIPQLLKNVTSPDYLVPDGVGDFVVFGITANMTAPRNRNMRQAERNNLSSEEWQKRWKDGSANQQKFLIVTLTDLKWTVDLFLFDNAVPRYHRLTPGTLIAILNPGIMPPKKGREDTGAFSLTLHDGEDQVLEIGKAKHLGYCKSIKKDGHQCSQWVNASKSEICEFHLNAQIDRTRGSRSGVNKSNPLADWYADPKHQDPRHKEKPMRNRRGFDHEAQTFYYSVGGVKPVKQKEDRWSFAPTANPNLSTAKLLDMHNSDDPFLAEGQMLERDKGDRLRKRMAAMAKEQEIAKKLGAFAGNAGGQYMRKRTNDDDTAVMSSQMTGSATDVAKEHIMGDRSSQTSKKRAADSVRLSPIKKKTRFLTDTGIKVAGRESLGAVAKTTDDDDDDLDIV